MVRPEMDPETLDGEWRGSRAGGEGKEWESERVALEEIWAWVLPSTP